MQQSTNDHRADLIRDLRAFADLLEARPDLPVDEFVRMDLQYSPVDSTGSYTDPGGADERIAEVHRLAAVLGVEVETSREGVVAARLDLGRVRYLAVAHSADSWARYEAEQSYRGAVQPEAVAA